MVEQIMNLLQTIGIEGEAASYMAGGALIILVIVLCIVGTFLANKMIIRLVTYYVKNNKYTWDDKMLEHKVFHRIAHLIPPLIIRFFAGAFPAYKGWIEKGTTVYMICVMLFVMDAFLNAVDAIYRTYEISKSKPIKGFLQVIKIVLMIIGGIIIIAVPMGEKPTVLLGGIGALTAVFTLVFKDSILGFVAGVQLTTDDMVRLGDWIEMPKYSADGVVIDLSLNTVKVENFDRTITTLPAYALISDSFKNWRGMEMAGGRRIKRSINLDISSISFCSEDMLERFKKIPYLKNYMEQKREELERYNRSQGMDMTEMINGRRLTNIGVFRIYVQSYLAHHPGIHQEMTLMVRQLASDGRGLPLEIYGFTSSTDWTKYENIQSDIFDHLLAVLPQFGLRVFQEPTGYDFQRL
jgi:miniconductance mechanosensitive channel